MDKLKRLLNLTMTLLETARPLTAAELRSRIPGYPEGEGSFRRAFERDKESLREMGIPVTMSLVPGSDPPADGYRIAKDEYYLRDPGFEPDELSALHLAASAVKLDTSHGIEALWKLGGTVEGADELLPTTSSTDALVALPSDPRLAPLFSAVVERRSVAFTYNGKDRTVDPYRLDFQRGRWYLTGYDHLREEERNFRVDRITDPQADGPTGAFQRPSTAVAGGPAQPWQFDEQEAVTATVLVDADQGPWVRQHLGDEALVDERADGSIVVQLEVTNRPAFRSFVLTFLDHAEVLGPPDLRTEMIDWVRAVARADPGTAMSSRITADERVQRMLSIVPWVAARPEGVPIDELCARFDLDRRRLVADLTTLSFVGVAPYTPDTQVDVVVEDGRVFVHLPQWFDRPLRLTAEQGLALVASGRSLLSIAGADPDGPLARGLAKLATSLGVGKDEALDVRLGDAAAGTVALLQGAIDDRHQVELDYYAYGRDERSHRVVEPQRLYADQGQWYLAAFCHQAGGDRIFHVDRIHDAQLLDATFIPPGDVPTLAVFQPAPDDPRVTLDLAPGARWVAEQYPTEAVVEQADGRLRVTLAITAEPWLERLLLRLGPEAEVVAADGDLAGAGQRAATRVLARYQRE